MRFELVPGDTKTITRKIKHAGLGDYNPSTFVTSIEGGIVAVETSATIDATTDCVTIDTRVQVPANTPQGVYGIQWRIAGDGLDCTLPCEPDCIIICERVLA